MSWYRVFLLLTVMLLNLPTGAMGQERGPLSVKEIERLVSAGVTPKRIVALVEQHGVNFELTAEVRERLRSARADAAVLTAVEQASVAYARKAMEEERQKIEEEKKKIEAAKQAEEKQRRAEEEKRRQEERKQAEAAKRKEAEQRKAEEEQRRREEQQRAEAARRQAEEAEQRKAAEAQRVGEMVAVPAGEFFMGCNETVDTECEGDEKPGRRVSVSAVTIDKTEVTVAQYARCVDAGTCSSDEIQIFTYNDGFVGTAPVGSFPSGVSPYGVLDMIGNVWEWTADWYDAERQFIYALGSSIWIAGNTPRPLRNLRWPKP